MSQIVFVVSRHFKRSALSSRQVWMKERDSSFLERVISCWSEEEFKEIFQENFQVSHETFTYLCSALKICLQRHYIVRRPLSFEHCVAITLWRLGPNIEYQSIGHLFGVGLSLVFVSVREVCEAVVDILYCLVISRYHLVIVFTM